MKVGVMGTDSACFEISDWFHQKGIMVESGYQHNEADFFWLNDCDIVLIQDLKRLNDFQDGSWVSSLHKNQIILLQIWAESVDVLAAQFPYPENVAGIHLSSPINKMKYIEVVLSYVFQVALQERLNDVWCQLHLKAVYLKDKPGLITVRQMLLFMISGIRMVEQNIASPGDIDKTMELGMNVKSGPLAMADRFGLDFLQYQLALLYQRTKLYKYRPSELLNQMVATGRGFHCYAAGKQEDCDGH